MAIMQLVISLNVDCSNGAIFVITDRYCAVRQRPMLACWERWLLIRPAGGEMKVYELSCPPGQDISAEKAAEMGLSSQSIWGRGKPGARLPGQKNPGGTYSG